MEQSPANSQPAGQSFPAAPPPPAPPSSGPSHPPLPSTSAVSTPSTPSPNVTPNPDTKPSAPKPALGRPWPQPQSHIPHLSSNISSPLSSLPTASSALSSSVSNTPPPQSSQRGGMAVGVPVHHPTPTPPPPASFSSLSVSSFGQPFGGFGRNAVNASDSVGTTMGRQSMQAIPGMGMMEPVNSSSQMRPSGIPTHHQQSSLKPQLTSNSSSHATQNLRAHGLVRVSAVGSSSSFSPSMPHSLQSHGQTWPSSEPQGKPPLPPSSSRRSITAQLQPRSHISQQPHLSFGASHQQQMLSAQKSQEPLPSSQVPQEHSGQQLPLSRFPQSSSPQQLQAVRGQVSGTQKSSSLGTAQETNMAHLGPINRPCNEDAVESFRILGKRSIHEIVSQVDPSERLDPEVEDILVDIAEDFVESITTFGCSLAKHRKSSTLEAKDILLHLERNWNMTLPGFSGDEIKIYKKPAVNDPHRERLAVIKKSTAGAEITSTKNPAGQTAGQTAGNAKIQLQRHQVKF